MRFLSFILLWTISLPADASALLFYNGKIKVGGPSRETLADWMAINEGKIVGYGVGEHYQSFEMAEKIDLKGKSILPVPEDKTTERSLGQAAHPLTPGSSADFIIVATHKRLARPREIASQKPRIEATYLGGERVGAPKPGPTASP